MEAEPPPPAANNGEPPDTKTALPPATRPTYTPYWSGITPRQARSVSNASLSAGQILLEDHSGESDELAQGCWAKSAAVDDYVLVSGATLGVGAYVVWHCTIQTLKGGNLVIRKR